VAASSIHPLVSSVHLLPAGCALQICPNCTGTSLHVPCHNLPLCVIPYLHAAPPGSHPTLLHAPAGPTWQESKPGAAHVVSLVAVASMQVSAIHPRVDVQLS
jgi:hypothetical protein